MHKMAALSVSLVILFFLSVSEVISECPPSSGKTLDDNCICIDIYLTRSYETTCYPNGSYFWDSSVNAVNEAISCVLPGTSLTTGQWVRVDCNSNS